MKKYKSVDEYISSFEKNKQKILKEIRIYITSKYPEAIESVSYGMPAYKYKGKPFAYFGAFKSHIGFYPTSGPIEKFEHKLKGYKYSKGAVQLGLDKKIPFDLIGAMLATRGEEIGQKNRAGDDV